MASTELKKEILKMCLDNVNELIEVVQAAMRDAQEAAEEEAASGADEMDASRAMAEIEKEKGSAQLAQALKVKEALEMVRADRNNETVSIGAVVTTTNGQFFLVAPAGKVRVNGLDYHAISPESPIGQKMSGLKVGDSFDINGREFKITQII